MRILLQLRRVLLLGIFVGVAAAQQPEEKPAPVERRDPAVEAASQWINRALFLRCFCAGNELTFDAAGKVEGQVKTQDWTLDGVQIQKVERRGPNQIELHGIRVVERYATDRREFDRKPQNDDKIHFLIADTGDAAGMDRTLRTIFADGIDRPFQLSLPEYWQHYFDPGLAWPPDGLTADTIYTFETPAAATAFNKSASQATVTHKVDAAFTSLASRDHVTGTTKIHMVVDTEGVPRRIYVLQPLGYGLDAKAVEAAAKYRFTPAQLKGKAVASTIVLDQGFVMVVAPQ